MTSPQMGVIARASIEDIVEIRDEAMDLYEEAFTKIAEADEALKAARTKAMEAHPGVSGYVSSQAPEIEAFMNAIHLPDRAQYMSVARKLTDSNIWDYLIQRTELESFMDKEAKDKLRAQMEYVPDRVDSAGAIINQDEIAKGLPPVTVETVEATLMYFATNSGEIFQRGVANALSKLDRRFKSHDGFGIKARVILTNCFGDWGHWNYGGHQRDTLIDIERAFRVMDGKKPGAPYGSIVGIVDEARRKTHGQHQSEHIGDYFKVRIFKNGNAHLWFTRKDLVVKVNKLLADYYGETLGWGADVPPDEEDIFKNPTLVPARYYGFFPTSDRVAEQVVEELPLYISKGDKPLRILEPSAGTGQLSKLLAQEWVGVEQWASDDGEYSYRHRVDCVEIQQDMAKDLSASGLYNMVWNRDFLTMKGLEEHYDIICMNPPFDMGRDIDHVMHAWKFLKTGGTLIAIMSAGTEFRETKKAKAFRDIMIKKQRGRFVDLPPGSFAHAGTNVNTLYLKVTKS